VLLIGHPGHSRDDRARARRLAHEAVARARVDLNVVRDLQHRERPLQPFRVPGRQAPVPAAVAAHDRAGAGEHALGVVGNLAVVDRRGGESAARGTQQRETAAHAEPDDPGLARAIGPPGQEALRRVECREGRAAARLELPEGAAHAAGPGLAPEQVGRQRQVAMGSELIGLTPDVVVQAEHLVDDDHARPRSAGPGRDSQVTGDSAARDRIAHVGHGCQPFCHQLRAARSSQALLFCSC